MKKQIQFLIAHNTFPIIRKQHTNFRNKNSIDIKSVITVKTFKKQT